jgi:hypothetical protein
MTQKHTWMSSFLEKRFNHDRQHACHNKPHHPLEYGKVGINRRKLVIEFIVYVFFGD